MDIVELQSVAMEDLAMLSKFLVMNSLLEGEDVVISDSLVIYLARPVVVYKEGTDPCD